MQAGHMGGFPGQACVLFPLHSVGQSPVRYLHLPAREAEQGGLAGCPGGRECRFGDYLANFCVNPSTMHCLVLKME